MKLHALIFAFAVAGCSSPGLIDTGRVAIVTGGLPAPESADLVAAPRPHLIGPFDRLSVEVLGLPEISRTVQVDANGDIALPLAGRVDVNGKTPGEVARVVESQLRASYVKDPHVSVNPIDTVSQTVAIDGEVEVPGIYPVSGDMTLMRAVARAQGTSDYASTTHVVVFRTVGEQRMAAVYDLRAIRLAAYADPEIFPGDVIVVGESQARRLFPQLLQGSGILLAPLVTLLNNR